jgi:hypothetical protein
MVQSHRRDKSRLTLCRADFLKKWRDWLVLKMLAIKAIYIRQWTAPVAYRVMCEMGVRFNDLGTFGRANRFTLDIKKFK